MYYFFNNPATTEISTLSLHDALPILAAGGHVGKPERAARVREGHVRDGVGERGGADQRARQRPLLHPLEREDRKSTRLNSSHANISYAVFCLKKKNSHTLAQQHTAIY